MDKDEMEKIEILITQYKWLTKNSETNMKIPFDKKLLYDKKFTNIAQAVLKKQMTCAPSYFSKCG